MEKIDLNKVRTFYYVAIEGSYEKASMHLGIKSSCISKQISYLENMLKIKLFKRSHRSLVLTEESHELFKSAQILMGQAEKIEEMSNIENKEKEDNTIRIVTTTGAASLLLVQKLKHFVDLYPQYKLRIITSDEKVDLLNHYSDVAILPNVDANQNIMQKKLFTVHIRLFASRAYLDKFGIPKNVDDLDNHRLISFYHNEIGHRGDVDWHLKLGVKGKKYRTPHFVINSAVGSYEAALQGIGIVSMAEEFPYIQNLVKILPDEGVDIPVYLAIHIQKRYLSKVIALEKFFMSTENIKDFIS